MTQGQDQTLAPVLRRDLELSVQEGADGPLFVFKDPARDRVVRFGPAEYFIVRLLDGRTTPEEICAKASAEFGEELGRDELLAFVNGLAARGLLEGTADPKARPRRRLGGSLLYLRYRIIDPDRLLDFLLPRVGFFYTLAFVWLSAAAIVTAVVLLVANMGEIGRDLTRLWQWKALFAAWALNFCVTVTHELAHGLTCKRFGGRVREIGFLLLYFQPALYCNVSDAWLFPEKSKRLWVTFAGGYWELFLWSMAIITWRISAPETVFNFAALVIMATSGVRLFMNLNPLLKLDGYYLLSDLVGIANLRSRSFDHIRDCLRWPWPPFWAIPSRVPARERRIFWAYGLLAGGFTVWLLSYIAILVGGFLVSRYQGWGFVIFVALLLLLLQRPLLRLLRSALPSRRLANDQAGGTKTRVALLLLAGALGLAMVFGRMELTVSGEFTIEPNDRFDLRAEVEAIVTEVWVWEGQRVAVGELVARLDGRALRAKMASLEAKIREKQAKLKRLESGASQEELHLAKQSVKTAKTREEFAKRQLEEAQRMRGEEVARSDSRVAKARVQLRFAEQEVKRIGPLIEKRVISHKFMEEMENQVSVRQSELDETRAELNRIKVQDFSEFRTNIAVGAEEHREAMAELALLESGSRAEDIEAARAEIEGLEADRRYVQEQLAQTEVKTPIAGVITTEDPQGQRGILVEMGDLILEVEDYSVAKAEILISEKEIADVVVDQRVILKARAFPDRTFEGRVAAISSSAIDDTSGLERRMFRVTTEIDNSDMLLRPGMTGFGKIYAGERPIWRIVTRRLVRFVKVEFWSWW